MYLVLLIDVIPCKKNVILLTAVPEPSFKWGFALHLPLLKELKILLRGKYLKKRNVPRIQVRRSEYASERNYRSSHPKEFLKKGVVMYFIRI